MCLATFEGHDVRGGTVLTCVVFVANNCSDDKLPVHQHVLSVRVHSALVLFG